MTDGWAIVPMTGGRVDPAHVTGRDAQVDDALERLIGGNNLLINDPRRLGKTAFLSRLGHLAKECEVVHVDCESVRSADEFMRRTIREIAGAPSWPKRARQALVGAFDALEAGNDVLKVRAELRHRRPDDLLVEALERFDDALDDSTLVVVAMDELTAGVLSVIKHEGAEAGRTLLAALRTVRQRERTHLRWVLTGSVGFHHVLRLAGETGGAVGDVHAFELGPLDDVGAAELGRRLLRGIRVEPDEATTAALVQTTGGIPYLLHHLVHRLRRSTVGPAQVADAWQAFLDDPDACRPMLHLLERVPLSYDEQQRRVAITLLDSLAAAAEPVQREAFDDLVKRKDRAAIGETLVLLESDHYLRRQRGNYRWRYPVLQEIWRYRRPR